MAATIPFGKQYTDSHDLVKLLKSRGLSVEDDTKAQHSLKVGKWNQSGNNDFGFTLVYKVTIIEMNKKGLIDLFRTSVCPKLLISPVGKIESGR